MNFSPRFLALATLISPLIVGSPLAAQQRTYTTGPTIVSPIENMTIRSAPRQPRLRYRPRQQRAIKSRYNKGLSLSSIRAGAIRQTLRDLERLRPYTNNFNRLRADIRRYWQRNITRPTTRGLAGTIMRHVKVFYRGFVRSQVYAGSRAGIVKVKRALKNRRR